MSACETCINPGRCCTGLSLAGGSFPKGETALEALVDLACAFALNPIRGRPDPGLPFIPLWKFGETWRLWCPNLTLDGRCGDYENRPYACEHYLPGTDKLCAMHGLIPEPIYDPADPRHG